MPRQYRPRVDASRLTTPRVARVPLVRIFPFDAAMPTSVSRPSIWRPAGSSDSLVDAGAEADATSARAAGASTVGGPGSPPSSPLPKRLRVRLEESKEKHAAHADLERRLRLAERIQVRAARRNPRFQGFPRITPFHPRAARAARARAPSPRSRRRLRPTRILPARRTPSSTSPPRARVRSPSRASQPPRRRLEPPERGGVLQPRRRARHSAAAK